MNTIYKDSAGMSLFALLRANTFNPVNPWLNLLAKVLVIR
jgi:hypothetical protein